MQQQPPTRALPAPACLPQVLPSLRQLCCAPAYQACLGRLMPDSWSFMRDGVISVHGEGGRGGGLAALPSMMQEVALSDNGQGGEEDPIE